MGHTNSTPNIGLPQFIGTDKPTWLGDINGAMSAIDTKVGSIDVAIATTDAKADNAVADASGAVTTATNAVNTAGAASTTATQANNLATQALTVANNTADLCTLQIVPDVNVNKAAIGTLSDLTTTAKDNLVDAINEVAQGGSGSATWSVVGTQTGSTAITISDTYNELCLVAASSSDQHIMTIVIPTAELDNTAKIFRDGGSLAADNYWGVTISVTDSSAQLGSFVVNGADNTASAKLTVYGR